MDAGGVKQLTNRHAFIVVTEVEMRLRNLLRVATVEVVLGSVCYHCVSQSTIQPSANIASRSLYFLVFAKSAPPSIDLR